MTTDRSLLELSARAACVTIDGWTLDGHVRQVDASESNYIVTTWNPLTDDGDALRLAIEKNMKILCRGNQCEVCSQDGSIRVIEPHYADKNKATRRAIVRAAAEIGRNMP